MPLGRSGTVLLRLDQGTGRPRRAIVRKIIHVDMAAFYASVEQRAEPALRGRPVAVGGSGARGVVMAASYEARAYGVRSAMPSVSARRRCPELVFVRPRFDAYKTASAQIRAIFRSYTDLVEPLALDEAYLDVTAARRGPASATGIARRMKALGIHTGAALRAHPQAELERRFGARAGRHYFRIARGEDPREVSPDRPYKSIGAEETFDHDLSDPLALEAMLVPLAETVARRMHAAGLCARTVTLKIKHHDFTIHTRQRTLAEAVRSADDVLALASRLLRTPEPP